MVCVSFHRVPCLVLWCGSHFKGSLVLLGPPLRSSRFVAMVFLNAIVRFMPLNIFACFCNISFVFCVFMHLCVRALRVALWHALAPCMVHGISMHVVYHIIVVNMMMFIIMFIMMIIDHHHVHHSLFVDQSLNDDC